MPAAHETHELFGGTVLLMFDPDKHRYTSSMLIDGRWTPATWTPSVTGITGIIAKGDGLTQWAVNCGVNLLEDELKPGEALGAPQIKALLRRVKYAWKEVRDTAGDIGSSVHEWIEAHIKAKLGQGEAMPRPTDKATQAGVDAFLNWEGGQQVEYEFSERKLYSPTHHYAGTVDAVARVKGKLTVIDFKTSNSIYDDYSLQVAAYAYALMEEFEEKVENRIILHLPKKTGVVTVHDLGLKQLAGGTSMEEDFEGFLGARRLYRRLRESKGR